MQPSRKILNPPPPSSGTRSSKVHTVHWPLNDIMIGNLTSEVSGKSAGELAKQLRPILEEVSIFLSNEERPLSKDQTDQLTAFLKIPVTICGAHKKQRKINVYILSLGLKKPEKHEKHEIGKNILNFNIKQNFELSKEECDLDDFECIIDYKRIDLAFDYINGIPSFLNQKRAFELLNSCIDKKNPVILKAMLTKGAKLIPNNKEEIKIYIDHLPLVVAAEQSDPKILKVIFESITWKSDFVTSSRDLKFKLLCAIIEKNCDSIFFELVKCDINFTLIFFSNYHTILSESEIDLSKNGIKIKDKFIFNLAKLFKEKKVPLNYYLNGLNNYIINTTEFRFDFIHDLILLYIDEPDFFLGPINEEALKSILSQFQSFSSKKTELTNDELNKLKQDKKCLDKILENPDLIKDDVANKFLMRFKIAFFIGKPRELKFYLDNEIFFKKEKDTLLFLNKLPCEEFLVSLIEDKTVSNDAIKCFIKEEVSVEKAFVMSKKTEEVFSRYLEFTDIFSLFVYYAKSNSSDKNKNEIFLSLFNSVESSQKGEFLFDILVEFEKERFNANFLKEIIKISDESHYFALEEVCLRDIAQQKSKILKFILDFFHEDQQQNFLTNLRFKLFDKKKLNFNQLKSISINFGTAKSPLKADINAVGPNGNNLLEIAQELNSYDLVRFCFENKINETLISHEIKTKFSSLYGHYYASPKTAPLSSAETSPLPAELDESFSERKALSEVELEAAKINKKIKTRAASPPSPIEEIHIAPVEEVKFVFTFKDKKGLDIPISSNDKNLVKLQEGYYAYWEEESIKKAEPETLNKLRKVFEEGRLVRSNFGHNGIKQLNSDQFEIKHCSIPSRILGKIFNGEVVNEDGKKSCVIIFDEFSRKGLHKK